ncbi:MAG TPA: TfoX/Sxy family protein [Solirubrobacterales bacterium]|nr:TfoX/Sxy family protein [Solirubrobacterales bacterium]
MAYDEQLAEEIRDRLDPGAGEVIERRMFGGLAFMVEGHLTIAASRGGGLLVRTDPADAEDVQALPGVEPMEMRGRKMPGWVFVDAEALRDGSDLDAWIERALTFVATLGHPR